MSSAPGRSPPRRDMDTAGYVQESDPLQQRALQNDLKKSKVVGDATNPHLAMVGAWATKNCLNVNGHVDNNHGCTGSGIDSSSISRQGMGYDQHAPTDTSTTTGASHHTQAASNQPRRANLDPMQRWVDEKAKEQAWNSVEMRRDKA